MLVHFELKRMNQFSKKLIENGTSKVLSPISGIFFSLDPKIFSKNQAKPYFSTIIQPNEAFPPSH